MQITTSPYIPFTSSTTTPATSLPPVVSNTDNTVANRAAATGFEARQQATEESTSAADYSELLELMLKNARNGDRVDKREDDEEESSAVERYKKEGMTDAEREAYLAEQAAKPRTQQTGFDFDPSRVDEYLAEMKAPETEGERKEDEGQSEDELQQQKDEQRQEAKLEEKISSQQQLSASTANLVTPVETERLLDEIEQSSQII